MDGHDLLREASGGLPPPDFLRSTFSRSCRSSAMCPPPSDGHIYFGNPGFGSFTSPLPFSSEVVSLGVHRSLSCVLLRSMVVVHFGAPALHADRPRALKCQSTWQSSVQTCGALISHDTWHPSGRHVSLLFS
jgi:hypothetical protein